MLLANSRSIWSISPTGGGKEKGKARKVSVVQSGENPLWGRHHALAIPETKLFSGKIGGEE